MSRPIALFLFSKSRTMAQPWADAGVLCYCVDSQLPKGERRDGNIIEVGADILRWVPPLGREIVFACAFTPCTHVAVSGARWFKGKGLYALADSIELFARSAEILDATGAPGFIENPVSTLASYWRKPDFTFHPSDYTAFELGDNYKKLTCIWAFGGFVMPPPAPAEGLGEPDDRIHKAAPGPERANFRSATPAGFARAVFEANYQKRRMAA